MTNYIEINQDIQHNKVVNIPGKDSIILFQENILTQATTYN